MVVGVVSQLAPVLRRTCWGRTGLRATAVGAAGPLVGRRRRQSVLGSASAAVAAGAIGERAAGFAAATATTAAAGAGAAAETG